jgi:hypothetical protein
VEKRRLLASAKLSTGSISEKASNRTQNDSLVGRSGSTTSSSQGEHTEFFDFVMNTG